MPRLLLARECEGERSGLPHLCEEWPLKPAVLQLSDGVGVLPSRIEGAVYLLNAQYDNIYLVVLLQRWWTKQGLNSWHL